MRTNLIAEDVDTDLLEEQYDWLSQQEACDEQEGLLNLLDLMLRQARQLGEDVPERGIAWSQHLTHVEPFVRSRLLLGRVDFEEQLRRVKAVNMAASNTPENHNGGGWPFGDICPGGIFVRSNAIQELMRSWILLYNNYKLTTGDRGD